MHRDTKPINNRLIFVWYMDEDISVWDTGKEEFLLQVNAPEDTIVDHRVSWDGSGLFYIHCEFIQAWDIWTGEAMGKVEYRDLNGVELLAKEGSRVWIRFYDQLSISMPSKGWNLGPSDLLPRRNPLCPQNSFISAIPSCGILVCAKSWIQLLEMWFSSYLHNLELLLTSNGMDNIWLPVFSLGWSWFWISTLHFLEICSEYSFFSLSFKFCVSSIILLDSYPTVECVQLIKLVVLTYLGNIYI